MESVEIKPIKVEIYRLPNGKIPFVEWVETLKDRKCINIIQKRLALLRLGTMGDFKFFDGIYELRLDYGPGYRIYCGKKEKTFCILLIGGSKATQRKDIEKAIGYWSRYKEETGG
jgi:putative addiction module killer protein